MTSDGMVLSLLSIFVFFSSCLSVTALHFNCFRTVSSTLYNPSLSLLSSYVTTTLAQISHYYAADTLDNVKLFDVAS